jgi:hypothetical protein
MCSVYVCLKIEDHEELALHVGSSYSQVSTVNSPRQLCYKIPTHCSAMYKWNFVKNTQISQICMLLKEFFGDLIQYLTFITHFLMPCVSISDFPKCFEVHKY